MIGKSTECLKRNKIDDFEKLRVIKSKQQAPNLNKILTKAEFSQKQVRVFKRPDKRCECCASLLLGISYTFKNVDKTFNLKAHFSCEVLIFFTLSLVSHVVKNTPVKLELVKPNSETVSESINNISDNLRIKNSR